MSRSATDAPLHSPCSIRSWYVSWSVSLSRIAGSSSSVGKHNSGSVILTVVSCVRVVADPFSSVWAPTRAGLARGLGTAQELHFCCERRVLMVPLSAAWRSAL